MSDKLREIHKNLVKLESLKLMKEIPFERFIETVKETAPEFVKEHILANPEEEYMHFIIFTASENINTYAQEAVDAIGI